MFDKNFFFTPLFSTCFWIRDPGWVKIRIRDPGETSRIRNTECKSCGPGIDTCQTKTSHIFIMPITPPPPTINEIWITTNGTTTIWCWTVPVLQYYYQPLYTFLISFLCNFLGVSALLESYGNGSTTLWTVSGCWEVTDDVLMSFLARFIHLKVLFISS